MPLPHLGITQPVRVCETCFEERNNQKIVKSPSAVPTSLQVAPQSSRTMQPRSARVEDDDDKDLKLALQMSLEEAKRSGIDTQPPTLRPEPPKTVPQPVVTQRTESSEDEDLKAAIAASLKDMEAKKAMEYPSVRPISQSPPVNTTETSDNASSQYQVLL